MATIVVEDGTQVSGANSYITEAELTTYATDRGITITGNNDELIIQAMDYIESLEYKGYKLTETQALVWPRGGVLVDGYYIDTDEIPQLLKDGQAEACLAIDAGNSPLADVERQVSKEKVDVIEVEYMDNAVSNTIVKKISAKLRKLLVSSQSGLAFTVRRG